MPGRGVRREGLVGASGALSPTSVHGRRGPLIKGMGIKGNGCARGDQHSQHTHAKKNEFVKKNWVIEVDYRSCKKIIKEHPCCTSVFSDS